jgi:hypothetical protein
VPSTIGVDGEMLQSTEQWILLYRSIYGSSGPTAGWIYASQPLHRRRHGLGADAVAGGAAGGVGGGETTLVTRDDLPDADSTLPTAINNKGEVVGLWEHRDGGGGGFLRRRDGTFIPTRPELGRQVHPRAINDDGVIAGETSSGGFVRLQDGTFVPVDHPRCGNCTMVTGINNRGQVVGQFQMSNVYGFIATLKKN